jgi:hypothetical protein
MYDTHPPRRLAIERASGELFVSQCPSACRLLIWRSTQAREMEKGRRTTLFIRNLELVYWSIAVGRREC